MINNLTNFGTWTKSCEFFPINDKLIGYIEETIHYNVDESISNIEKKVGICYKPNVETMGEWNKFDKNIKANNGENVYPVHITPENFKKWQDCGIVDSIYRTFENITEGDIRTHNFDNIYLIGCLSYAVYGLDGEVIPTAYIIELWEDVYTDEELSAVFDEWEVVENNSKFELLKDNKFKFIPDKEEAKEFVDKKMTPVDITRYILHKYFDI